MKKFFRVLINAVLVICVLLLFGIMVISPLTGLTLEPVLSGSMEPTIHTGALIGIAHTDPEGIQEGDIIGFRVKGMDTPVCHRVIEVVRSEAGTAYRTQGDANEGPDDWLVLPQDIIGKVYFNIAWLGIITRFVKTPQGFILLMGVPAAIIIGLEMYNLFRPAVKKRKRPDLRPRSNPAPLIIALLIGAALIAVPWAMMSGNSTSRTLGSMAPGSKEDSQYSAIRNLTNKGKIPLVICLASDDPAVVFSENSVSLLPGETREIEITGESPAAVVRTAGLFSLLPREMVYSLFTWNPQLAPAIIPAVWILPLTALGYLAYRTAFSGRKPYGRAKYFKSELSHG